MPLNPFVMIEIHSCCLMAIEFSQCYWMATKLIRHTTMATKNLLIATCKWQPKGFWSPRGCGDWNFFNCHPHVVIERLLVATVTWWLKGFGHHNNVVTKRFSITTFVWQPKTFQLPQCFSLPPPLIFFPFFNSSPLMVTETFSISILCDHLVKKWGY